MHTTEKYIKKNKGKLFEFRIKKILEVPEHGVKRYVIEDKEGTKFTLSYKQYAHYNFKPGDAVSCRLDHINCSGEVFFEPENPKYTEGGTYSFKVLGTKDITNYLGLKEHIVLVEDDFGKEQWVRYAKGAIIEDSKINAFVAKIKKGRLNLLPINSDSANMHPGSQLSFNLIGQSNNDRLGACFVVKDPWENQHAIPMSYYTNYGYKVGSHFQGDVLKLSSKGFFYIEPEHPIYKLDKDYSFKVFETINTTKGVTAFVIDCYDNPIKVNASSELKVGDEITCSVLAIQKGKPKLQFVSLQRAS